MSSIYIGFEELATICGEQAALKLVAARGGTSLYVPGKLPEDHWLVEVMGLPAAAALVADIVSGRAGATIEIPVGPSSWQERLRAGVRAAIAEGWPESKIVKFFGVSGRAVRRARDRLRQESGAQE